MLTTRSLAPLLTAGLLLAGACTPIVDNRGNLPDNEAVAALKPGVHTKANVMTLLGSPSNVGTFSDNSWYYISRRTETRAFFRPEMVDQQVLVVRFDDQGVIKEVDKRGTEVAQDVDHVKKSTPTAGHSMTLLEQLFGNIGQFERDAGAKP